MSLCEARTLLCDGFTFFYCSNEVQFKNVLSLIHLNISSEGSIMAEKKETKTKEATDVSNMVFVGKKGAMAYVLAVVTQFGEGAKDVTLKARGKSISRAVDVAEIVRNKPGDGTLESINISTEEVETEDGRPLKISAIAIKLNK
jgi:archaea-specific DNA-binding protein